VVKKYISCQAQCDDVGASVTLIFPGLVTAGFFLFLLLKSVLKGQGFASAEEVVAKATRALTEVSRNGFQECFETLYERGQKCVTAQGNYFEGDVV
jgi:hypothetical protein